MKRVLAILFILSFLTMLSGCCAMVKMMKCESCKAPPAELVIQTKYETIPDHLLVGCNGPEKIAYGVTAVEVIEKQQSQIRLCSSMLDLIRQSNDDWKKKTEEELKKKGP